MKFLFPVSALVLAACASPVASQPPQGARAPESLYAVQAGRDQIRFRVSSNGCTRKEDFRLATARQGPAPSLRLDRIRPDECKSFAIGSAWIEFSYAEAGLGRDEAFTVMNPLTAWRGPGD